MTKPGTPEAIAELSDLFAELVELHKKNRNEVQEDVQFLMFQIDRKVAELTAALSDAEKLLLLQLGILCPRPVSLEDVHFVFSGALPKADFEAYLDNLVDKGLVNRDAQAIHINYVVTVAMRNLIKPTQENCAVLVVDFVEKLDALVAEKPEARFEQSRYLPLLETIAADFDEISEAMVKLYTKIGLIYSRARNFNRALGYHHKAIDMAEKALGTAHPALARAYNNISLIYQDLKDLQKALDYQQKAIAIVEKALGSEHPNLATSYNNVSTIYQDMGNPVLALMYQNKAIDIKEKILGLNHPDLATSYNSMAFITFKQGHRDKAVEWLQKAVTILKANFPNGHPHLTTALNSLEFLQSMPAEK